MVFGVVHGVGIRVAVEVAVRVAVRVAVWVAVVVAVIGRHLINVGSVTFTRSTARRKFQIISNIGRGSRFSLQSSA